MEINRPKDDRLQNLVDGQYRIWHDGQNIMIPLGQSTTKPKQAENINANTKVYGEIQKGYFNPPLVDFSNTYKTAEYFDYYFLQTWRDADNIPIDDNNFIIEDDLSLKKLLFSASIIFSMNTMPYAIQGIFEGYFWLNIVNGEWTSDLEHFSGYDNFNNYFGNQFLEGNFKISSEHDEMALNSEISEYQINGRDIFINVYDCKINNGLSTYTQKMVNPYFILSLIDVDFVLVGGVS